MEATYTSETSVDFQRTAWHCNTKARTLYNPRCENLRFFIRVVQIRNRLHAELFRPAFDSFSLASILYPEDVGFVFLRKIGLLP
jgi:hypothetical protein